MIFTKNYEMFKLLEQEIPVFKMDRTTKSFFIIVGIISF